ncbi:hypothetical protein CK203_075058 [Vitis vinifera]|uniref:Uncharacterized protein n=1 Tax=Vitis vinifera TaxID=29760 RepID=A0A438F9J5_VITVI|nr:hypothetical protein CK203_075058 [Vitis vinifera]
MLLRFLGHVDCDQAVYCSGVARDLACSAQAYSQDVERDGEGGLVAEEDERARCEGGVMRRNEETCQCMRMLTREIRKSLDRHTILYTTIVELARACSWIIAPSGGGRLGLGGDADS